MSAVKRAHFIRAIARYAQVRCERCGYGYAWRVSPYFCPQCASDHNSVPVIWINRKFGLNGWYFVPLLRDRKPLKKVPTMF